MFLSFCWKEDLQLGQKMGQLRKKTTQMVLSHRGPQKTPPFPSPPESRLTPAVGGSAQAKEGVARKGIKMAPYIDCLLSPSASSLFFMSLPSPCTGQARTPQSAWKLHLILLSFLRKAALGRSKCRLPCHSSSDKNDAARWPRGHSRWGHRMSQ